MKYYYYSVFIYILAVSLGFLTLIVHIYVRFHMSAASTDINAGGFSVFTITQQSLTVSVDCIYIFICMFFFTLPNISIHNDLIAAVLMFAKCPTVQVSSFSIIFLLALFINAL